MRTKGYWNFIQNNLDKINNEDKSYNWDILSSNPNITWDIIQNNPDIDWQWESVSKIKCNLGYYSR